MKTLFCSSREEAWNNLHEKYLQASNSKRYSDDGEAKDLGGSLYLSLREGKDIEGVKIGDTFGELMVFGIVYDPYNSGRVFLLMKPL